MTQSEARKRTQQLIEKFCREQAAGVISQYNESETKTIFEAGGSDARSTKTGAKGRGP